MLKVAIVVGNPKPKSRTLRVAEVLAEKMLPTGSYQLEVVDLARHTAEIFEWPSDSIARLNASVASSDLVLVASPTYKGSYTGLLKAFFDRYPANGLRGVIAIPVMTGADAGHSMAPAVTLGPLLLELGAIVPVRGFYFVIGDMNRLTEIAQETANSYGEIFAQLSAISADISRPQLLPHNSVN